VVHAARTIKGKRGAGRPPLPPEKHLRHRVVFHVTGRVLVEIKRTAKREQVKLPDWLRAAIGEAMERRQHRARE
jgi:phosphatidylethanolamine-binding protein (PEBP) family uncharacterized protein